eukprot:g855.t1
MRDHDREIERTRFLWGGYKPKYWWFEVFEMFRKFFMTGVPICINFFIGSNQKYITLAYGFCVTALTTAAHQQFDPYLEKADSFLLLPAQFEIFLSLVAGMLMDIAGEDSKEVEAGVSFVVVGTGVPIVGFMLYAILFPDRADAMLAQAKKRAIQEFTRLLGGDPKAIEELIQALGLNDVKALGLNDVLAREVAVRACRAVVAPQLLEHTCGAVEWEAIEPALQRALGAVASGDKDAAEKAVVAALAAELRARLVDDERLSLDEELRGSMREALDGVHTVEQARSGLVEFWRELSRFAKSAAGRERLLMLAASQLQNRTGGGRVRTRQEEAEADDKGEAGAGVRQGLAHGSERGLHYTGEPARWRRPNDGLLRFDWRDTDSTGLEYSGIAHVFNLESRLAVDTVAYSDSDWAADTGDRRSYESSLIEQCCGAVWWRASKANLVGLSTAETETDAAVATCKGALFVLGVTRQMMMPQHQWTAALPPPRVRVYIDNQAAIAMLNKQSRGRNRHMDIRLKFLQLHADIKTFDSLYIPTNDNDADLNTEVLSAPVFRALLRRAMGEDTQTDGMALAKDAICALHARTPPRDDAPQASAK